MFPNEQFLYETRMIRKNWSDENREKQSKLIMRVKPWEHSTGPRSQAGKRRSKMNAQKHGFGSESLREYRKTRRRPEVMELEYLCKDLIKRAEAGDIEETTAVMELLGSRFEKLGENFIGRQVSPEMLLEVMYTMLLLSRIMTYAARKSVKRLSSIVFEN